MISYVLYNNDVMHKTWSNDQIPYQNIFQLKKNMEIILKKKKNIFNSMMQ
jgi:hypothetical protein